MHKVFEISFDLILTYVEDTTSCSAATMPNNFETNSHFFSQYFRTFIINTSVLFLHCHIELLFFHIISDILYRTNANIPCKPIITNQNINKKFIKYILVIHAIEFSGHFLKYIFFNSYLFGWNFAAPIDTELRIFHLLVFMFGISQYDVMYIT